MPEMLPATAPQASRQKRREQIKVKRKSTIGFLDEAIGDSFFGCDAFRRDHGLDLVREAIKYDRFGLHLIYDKLSPIFLQ